MFYDEIMEVLPSNWKKRLWFYNKKKDTIATTKKQLWISFEQDEMKRVYVYNRKLSIEKWYSRWNLIE